MKISTRSRYGLRAMVAISRNGGDVPISCEEIAEKEGVSKKYLDRIMGMLRNASLVESHRGQGGGYCLARPAGEIHLDEVVSVLEKGLAVIPCQEDPCQCCRSDECTTREVWSCIASAVEGSLRDITLADISG